MVVIDELVFKNQQKEIKKNKNQMEILKQKTHT